MSSLFFPLEQNKPNRVQLHHVHSEVFYELISSKEGVLLDVRTQWEYLNAHIEGAEHLDFYGTDFAEKLLLLNREEMVLLYCRTGHRSRIAGEFLVKNGYSKVYNLEKGIVEWYAIDLPMKFSPEI